MYMSGKEGGGKKTQTKIKPNQRCVTAGNEETQAHRVGRASDLLEVGDQLSFAGELRLALWTFEVVVLQPLGLLARQGHQRLGALRCASDRSRLSRRRSRSVLHRAGVGGGGGAPGRGGGRGDWRRGGRRGEQAWSATGGNQERQMGNETGDESQMNDRSEGLFDGYIFVI